MNNMNAHPLRSFGPRNLNGRVQTNNGHSDSRAAISIERLKSKLRKQSHKWFGNEAVRF